MVMWFVVAEVRDVEGETLVVAEVDWIISWWGSKFAGVLRGSTAIEVNPTPKNRINTQSIQNSLTLDRNVYANTWN